MTRKPKRPSRQRPEVDPRDQRWKHNALDSREPDNKDGTDGKPIWRVSYHDGSLFALVEAAMPDEAVEIAMAHRKANYRGTPPKSFDDDSYEVGAPTVRDILWCHECRVGVQTEKPPRKRTKGAPIRLDAVRAIRLPQDVERADAAYVRAA